MQTIFYLVRQKRPKSVDCPDPDSTAPLRTRYTILSHPKTISRHPRHELPWDWRCSLFPSYPAPSPEPSWNHRPAAAISRTMNDDAISTPKANEIQLQFHADIQGQSIKQSRYAYCYTIIIRAMINRVIYRRNHNWHWSRRKKHLTVIPIHHCMVNAGYHYLYDHTNNKEALPVSTSIKVSITHTAFSPSQSVVCETQHLHNTRHMKRERYQQSKYGRRWKKFQRKQFCADCSSCIDWRY